VIESSGVWSEPVEAMPRRSCEPQAASRKRRARWSARSGPRAGPTNAAARRK
jgi:hypothetical protein